MTPGTDTGSRLANILTMLLGLAAIATEAFVKNPQHHATAEAILGTITKVAEPIAAQLSQESVANQTPKA